MTSRQLDLRYVAEGWDSIWSMPVPGLIEFARLVGEGGTDGPDGRLQLKFSPCLFITQF